MNKDIRHFISWCILLISTLSLHAQEPSFYLRLNRSMHLSNQHEWQWIPFENNDIIYNHLVDFTEKQIKIIRPGTYEINGFVNINPGIIGNKNDSITIEVAWFVNQGQPNEHILYATQHTYTKGNLDVSRSFLFPEQTVELQSNDHITIGIRLLEESTASLNESKGYHHLNHPTGFAQIAGLRLHWLGN